MPTWEYVTTPLIVHNTTAILNNWGSEGWELVQVVQGPEGALYLLTDDANGRLLKLVPKK